MFIFSWNPREGDTQKKFYTGRLLPEVQPFTLLYTILHISRNFYNKYFCDIDKYQQQIFFILLHCIECIQLSLKLYKGQHPQVFCYTQQKLHRGRLRPEVQPFTLLYTILQGTSIKTYFCDKDNYQEQDFFCIAVHRMHSAILEAVQKSTSLSFLLNVIVKQWQRK